MSVAELPQIAFNASGAMNGSTDHEVPLKFRILVELAAYTLLDDVPHNPLTSLGVENADHVDPFQRCNAVLPPAPPTHTSLAELPQTDSLYSDAAVCVSVSCTHRSAPVSSGIRATISTPK